MMGRIVGKLRADRLWLWCWGWKSWLELAL